MPERVRDWRPAIEARLAGLGVEPSRQAEIVEELSKHLQDRYDDLLASGDGPDEARRAALTELDAHDPRDRHAAESDQRQPQPFAVGTGGLMTIGALPQDVRYALRTFRKNPGFTAVVVVTLALGIGATAAIFSVLDAVMLRPLPYPDSDRIMILNETTRAGQGMSISWPNFQDWHEQNKVFEHLGVYRPATLNLTGGDRPERLNGSMASSEVFKALGIQPVAGRAFLPEDDRPLSNRVTIISERLWRGRFNADPGIVGTSITLNGEPHVVVGIMPHEMRFPSRLTDAWLPLGLFVNTFSAGRGNHPGLFAVGKLKPGVGLEQANASMDTLAHQLERLYPESNRDHAIAIVPYYEQIVRNIRPALLLLIGSAGFVLLIACLNLANLMLAKADGRQREMVVRAALGAGRRQIVQQLLTESVLLAGAGGAFGAVLASWGVKAFVGTQPTTVPRIDLVSVDMRVLTFVAAISMVTGIAFGLVPALRAASVDLAGSLKEAARGSTLAPGGRFRSALVVAEVALALTLLIGAGLTIKSFGRLMAIDPGFSAEHVLTLRLMLPDARYPDRSRWTAFHEQLLRRLRALPGIVAVGVNSAVPLEGGGAESPVIAEGQPMPGPNHPDTMCLFQTTSPDYFRAMGIPLLRGRSFTDRDTATSTPVVVVDETLVTRLFSNADPIGKHIAFEFTGHSLGAEQPVWREIVGVVRHVRHYGLTSEPVSAQVYASFSQLPLWVQQRRPAMAIIARTAAEPETMAASIRTEVAALDRDLPAYGLQTMGRYLAQNTEQPRLNVELIGAFAALALILSVVGIYGVVSYSVSRRTHELGIRMALGATRRDVLRLIIGHGMALTAIGIVLGLCGSWALTTFLRTLLFQISPHDPITFASIGTLLAMVALLASYLPGRRATRVDPVIALRSE